MNIARLAMLLATLTLCSCERHEGNARAVAGVDFPANSTGVEVALSPPVAARPQPSGLVDANWSQAAPIVDGYSDPNRIVYDDTYLRSYENRDRSIRCGSASYEIVSRKYSIVVFAGLDERKLGWRFRIDDLLRFLETRRDNPHFEQVFPVRDVELLKRLRENNYGWDPWTEHLRAAMTLVGSIAYKPAIPLLAALATKDPDVRIRIGAVMALGLYSRAHPEALEVLNGIAADPVRGEEADVGLKMAKNVGGPMVFAKPLDQPDAKYGPMSAHQLE